MHKQKLLSTGALLVGLALFVALNIFADYALRSVRVDMTEGKLFTLSQGSRNIVSSLDEPIDLRFFYSEKLASGFPQLQTYAQRVREMLEEFVAASRGKLRLQLIDPEPFSDKEDLAVEYGMQGAQINQAGELVYFGLSGTNSTDQNETIPFFADQREQFLEYDLARLLYNLSQPKKKIVGVMSSLPIDGQQPANAFMGRRPGESEPWVISGQIREQFEARQVESNATSIEKDVDVLVLVHPKELSPQTRYAIDQFVLRGGRLLAFVDPHCEVEEVPQDPNNPLQSMMAPKQSSLSALLAGWGAEMVEGKIAASRTHAQKVRAGSQTRPETVDYVAWFSMTADELSDKDAVTGEVRSINVASPGILKPLDGATTTFTRLAWTTKESMAMDVARVQAFPDPKEMLASFASEGSELTIAARLEGSVSSIFPDGRPPTTDEKAVVDDTPHLTQSEVPINVIVVADADMLADRYWVQVQDFLGQRIAIPAHGNGNFVINALDNLCGSEDLISVRGRNKAARPFERVLALQRDAESRFRTKEQELLTKLRDTEGKIRQLQQEKGGGASALILSPEQRAEVDRFKEEKLKIRKELREVQHQLKRDIEQLAGRLKFYNIGLVPILVGGVAVVMGWFRINRRRRR